MLEFKADVLDALNNNQPVVALESTIISHGLPYPENLTLAREVEAIIREAGATPATIAMMNGAIKIGLTDAELTTLAESDDVQKASKRDFAYLLASKKLGATTVAGTLLAASMAGIRVFATGGLGGVHRGGETTLDISRDLEELALQPVAVVSAGVKSILDIGKTLEYLETKGVEVLGYQTDFFPAFYTRTSPYKVDYRLDTAADIAALMHAKFDSGIDGGLLVANPIPDAHAMDETLINAAIDQALKDAAAKQITGKRITPFLLDAIKTITDGKSLAANLALMKHNAQVAAEIAVAYTP